MRDEEALERSLIIVLFLFVRTIVLLSLVNLFLLAEILLFDTRCAADSAGRRDEGI